MKTRKHAKNHLRKICSKKQRGGVTAEQQEKDKRLLQAVDRNDPDKVSEALDDGANINTLGAFGNTALLIASKNGYTEVVERLLSDKGVNRNVMNRYGDTAFGWAKYNEHVNYNKDNHKKTLKLIKQHIVEQPLPNIMKRQEDKKNAHMVTSTVSVNTPYGVQRLPEVMGNKIGSFLGGKQRIKKSNKSNKSNKSKRTKRKNRSTRQRR
jgi:ankyrin repeat protein